jgi:hypothetical protein
MLAIGVLFASSLVTAQGVWTQLGLTDANARAYATQVLDLGGPNHLRTYDPAVLHMKEAWYKLPASARGPAMTAIYAWTKALVTTPAFRTEYTAARTKQKPVMPQPTGTVDQEVKARLAKDAAEQEAALKMLEANGMKAQADAQRKQGAQLQKTMATIYASEIEEQRARDKAAYDRATKNWEATFPADVNAFLAKNLREFLDTTGDVDFTAKLVRSPVDNSLGLADPVLRRKPWQWQESVLYGPEAIAAARTAASAWLKELGK